MSGSGGGHGWKFFLRDGTRVLGERPLITNWRRALREIIAPTCINQRAIKRLDWLEGKLSRTVLIIANVYWTQLFSTILSALYVFIKFSSQHNEIGTVVLRENCGNGRLINLPVTTQLVNVRTKIPI